MQQSHISQFVLHYQGRSYALNKPQTLIGSDPGCDIHITDNSRVSPRHAQIITQDDKVFLQFMERGAPIWVNGAPASQQLLKIGDEIALGNANTVLTLSNGVSTSEIPTQRPLDRPSAPKFDPGSGRDITGRQEVPRGYTPQPPIVIPGPPMTPPVPQPAMGVQQQGNWPTPPLRQKSNVATETTRYLCAAGHLDENFQNYVMHHVVYEEHRALGESYGVDMSVVISWCKAGRNRLLIRDGILSALIGLVVVLYVFSLCSLVGSIISSFAYIFQTGFSTILSLFGALLLTVLIPIIVLITFNIERWIKRRWPKSHPGFVSPFLLLFGAYGWLVVPLIWLTILIELFVRYYGKSIQFLRKNTFNPQFKPVPLDANLEAKLHENFATSQRNVIAYSGYKPFTGAGTYQGGWSFVTNMSKGKCTKIGDASSNERLTPQRFAIRDLYAAVERDVWALDLKDVLEIEGKLYARGQFLPETPDFFNGTALRPVTSVHPSLVEQYKEHPTEDIRYYQCMRFNFWRGEMILTAFLRFVQRGKDLFAEVNYLLLSPMKPEYYWVDYNERTPGLLAIWDIIKTSFDSPIKLWLSAPSRLWRSSSYARELSKILRFARTNPAFDYGAPTSLRQEASDDEYHLFFQQLDEEMYFKIINKQILETIADFLDERGIDTSELREQVQMIVNNSTTNNNIGGQMNVGNNNMISGNNTQTGQSNQKPGRTAS